MTFEDACAIVAPNVVRANFPAKPRAISAPVGWIAGPAEPPCGKVSLTDEERAYVDLLAAVDATAREIGSAGMTSLNPNLSAPTRQERALHTRRLVRRLHVLLEEVVESLPHPTTPEAA